MRGGSGVSFRGGSGADLARLCGGRERGEVGGVAVRGGKGG